MSNSKAIPLRLQTDIFNALKRWAEDDLRSVNAQIEFQLREALRKAGRLPSTEKVKKS